MKVKYINLKYYNKYCYITNISLTGVWKILLFIKRVAQNTQNTREKTLCIKWTTYVYSL